MKNFIHKNKVILIIILTLLSLSAILGYAVYQAKNKKKLQLDSEEATRNYLENKVNNSLDNSTIDNIIQNAKKEQIRYIQKKEYIILKNEYEKEAIDTIDDNTILRHIGKSTLKRYNLRRQNSLQRTN